MHFHNDVETGWLCVGSLVVREFKPKVLVLKDGDALRPYSVNVLVVCVLLQR